MARRTLHRPRTWISRPRSPRFACLWCGPKKTGRLRASATASSRSMAMPEEKVRLWLMRHGETEWSLSGAHTGRTDIPLTERGRENARKMGEALQCHPFALVLTSPLSRARDTCALAGYGKVAQIEPDLHEWEYGEYEGRSTADIRGERPGWELWNDGVPNGETVEQVGVDRKSV